MSIAPIITFKAGLCDLDTSVSPPRVKPKPAPGYIYLYLEDDLVHFCWRRRSASLDEPELDLVMVPSDGTFTPYNPTSAQNPSNTNRPTNGRVYALKFSSSSQRHLFWLQSGSQHPNGNPAWFSTRDLEVGRIVNALLQGEDIDVAHAISNPPMGSHDGNGGDDPSSVIQNLLRSLQQSGNQHSGSEAADNLFTTLSDLLQPSSTLPFIESADSEAANHLLSFLPTCLLFLSQSNIDEIPNNIEPGSEAAKSAMQTLTLEQKRDILRRVLRSPQFTQSLGSLTVALRDGGLPSISDALKIPVANNGFMRHGNLVMLRSRIFLEQI
ncbi:conserved hypothetical protein [Histoplasma mississippiense (nom. inval.)]|uniref:conserved hypothetical protein n=1 Tax=Ajellomyces capsulatus (strain NAm1 / WU24) TaxID=2059318 RepID=UPI000157B821|nr:conserved hypothetical protein [Histoplasma mississippiense (nom. inval.)]EDN03929.1 conserved hypothetical protein [Histoplasma mississippiense (nom. inval.)]